MNATAEQTEATTETTTQTTTKFVVEEYLPFGYKWVWSSDHDNVDDAKAQKSKWAAACPTYKEHNLFRVVEKTVTTTTKVVG